MPAAVIKTYRGQSSVNTTTIGTGTTTFYVANLGGYFNNNKVATIESHIILFDQLNFATSSGWIHYIAPLNTGLGFSGTTFAGISPKPNLPGADVPPNDDGVLSVNGGNNWAFLQDFRFEPSTSQLFFRVNQISGIGNHPISYKVNWKLTCF